MTMVVLVQLGWAKTVWLCVPGVYSQHWGYRHAHNYTLHLLACAGARFTGAVLAHLPVKEMAHRGFRVVPRIRRAGARVAELRAGLCEEDPSSHPLLVPLSSQSEDSRCLL